MFAQRDAAIGLQSRMENVGVVQSQAIAGPVWVLDDQQISLVITAMSIDPDIRGVIVFDERDEPIGTIGQMVSDTETLLTTEHPILFSPRTGEEGKNIGSIRISYSASRIEELQRERFFLALGMAAIMSLIAVGGAVLALRMAVNRPLGLFLERIRQAREGDEGQDFVWNHQDEIGVLVATYNELQSSQIRFRNELADIRDQLEIRVLDRTKDLREREDQLVKARDQAESALDSLKLTQEQLVESKKLASLGQLTAGIAHEIKNPLNFMNNFSQISQDLLNELMEDLEDARSSLPAEDSAAVDDVVTMLLGNLSKINEHGARADSIVKNMLAHSREAPDAKTLIDINALAKEAMALVYHGLRAEQLGFNITMDQDLGADLPHCICFPQELQRAIMNVVMNGMQAASKHHEALGDPSRAVIKIATRLVNKQIEIEIWDNGPGMSEELQSRIFNPFFTTKSPGEGTGLGLSMAHDIVVIRHGGEMHVESSLGEHSAFLMRIPMGA
ncbi:ATP-binding protein [Rhodobacteraceae bacterium]|nr:ATP-binding protein [Paracoccaceae bacterium]